MHIAIDARAWGWAGVGRYTRNLITHLAQLPTTDCYTVLLGSDHVAQFEKLRQAFLHPEKWTHQCVEKSYYSWREQVLLWRELEQVDADLYHFTHFNIPLLFRRPYVVTIHDGTRFVFPGQKKQSLFQQLAYERVFKHAVTKAVAVITVSEAAAQDLRGLPLGATVTPRIIHEGVEERFLVAPSKLERTKVRMHIGTSDPFILYVGVWLDHKNLYRLLTAFAELKHSHPKLKLVMTGKPVPKYSNVLDMVRKLNIKEAVHFAGFVPDALLPALYAESRCLLMPSLYEGFGLPVLEAAAVGTPVVASNVTSLPELLPGAAYFVNPEYVPDISAGIRAVLDDQALRQRLIRQGQKRARDFSWRSSAEAHVAVYAEARKSVNLKDVVR